MEEVFFSLKYGGSIILQNRKNSTTPGEVIFQGRVTHNLQNTYVKPSNLTYFITAEWPRF
jgi:hypothetical protein